MDKLKDTQSIESIPQEIQPLEIPVKHFIPALDRDKTILERYMSGIMIKDIAKEFKLSEVRISQIVKANKQSAFIDREFEKTRRLREIKKLEQRAKHLEITPKDAKELLAVYEAQRKELEGDGPSTVTNTQINIQGDVKILDCNSKWTMLRSALENT